MILVISVGRNKMFGAQESEYLKRIRPFSKIELCELKEYSSENPGVSVKKEADAIFSRLKNREFFALDKGGESVSSEEFSSLLKSAPDVAFVIGGAYGLSQEILKKAKKSISFSKMTFTHEIARILLLEQIYRGYAILNGRKYHK